MRGRERHRELSMQVDDRVVDVGQDDALPSVATMMFLALCDRYGSHEAARRFPGAGGLEWRVCPTATTGRSGPPPRCVRRSSIFKKPTAT